MSEGLRRRLAAIMFADMVGYTAIMQENEEQAQVGRARFRKALDAAVREHHGEILQHYGDGTLTVFGSAVEAVSAAVDIQAELRRDPSVPVRIGVHTGDIVHDADGVYGDGVNVASRIESLSAPGGVLVSGKVYDEIKNHAFLSVTSLGDVELKNVKRPLKVFAITNEGLHVPTLDEVRARAGTGDAASESPDTAAGLDVESPPGAGERLLEAVRRRALVQWLLLYVVGAWALLQAGSWAAAAFAWPPLVQQSLMVAAAMGLPVTLVVTWYHGEKGRQRVTGPEVLMIAVLLALAGGILTALERGGGSGAPGAPAAGPDLAAQAQPSVAVLPFTNMTGAVETEPFAAGIHDDVLTQLSKIAGLSVISRTSVLGYRETDKSVPEIARELGVGAVLEGGVQRAGDRIRINVQLIDAVTDAHLWGETFDTVYTVENVFHIQSAIAVAIADALEAVLTREELAGLDDVPTEDIEAYELYLSGVEHMGRPGWRIEDLERAQQDFQDATVSDPDFALAYVNLGVLHYLFIRVGYDTSTERLELVREQAERALEIDPDLPEAHQLLSHYLYLTGQTDRALAELAVARRGLPSDPWVPVTLGTIRQRQGAWEQAVAAFERAVELDPRNPELFFLLGDTYAKMRRWDEAERLFDRALAIAPGLPEARLLKAMVAIDKEGTPGPLVELFEDFTPAEDPLGQAAFMRWWAYFLARDFQRAEAVLADLDVAPEGWQVQYPVAALRGLTLMALGRPADARRLVEADLPRVERLALQRPDDAMAHAGLGITYAVLGRKDEAIREGLRATEAVPVAQDAYMGPGFLADLARIYTLTGEHGLAVDLLETLLSMPGDLSVNAIRLDPMWDPLRDLPRYRELVGG